MSVEIIDTKHFIFDVLYRPRSLGLGITIGNNKTRFGKWTNVYLEIDILFWTFGFEIKWKGEK